MTHSVSRQLQQLWFFKWSVELQRWTNVIFPAVRSTCQCWKLHHGSWWSGTIWTTQHSSWALWPKVKIDSNQINLFFKHGNLQKLVTSALGINQQTGRLINLFDFCQPITDVYYGQMTIFVALNLWAFHSKFPWFKLKTIILYYYILWIYG